MRLAKWTFGYLVVLWLASSLDPFLGFAVAVYIVACESLIVAGPWGAVNYSPFVSRFLIPDRFKFITLGRTIWVRNLRRSKSGAIIGKLTVAEARHEWAHVAQWEEWRSLFPIVYGIAHWRFGYDRNPFEVAASKAAGKRP